MATQSVAELPAAIPRKAENLVEILCWRAGNEPTRLAYTFLNEPDDPANAIRLTYEALDARARAIAVRLTREGAAGTRALLVYDPGLEYVAAVFGCLYAGVIAVPVYPPDPLRFRRTWPRLQAILHDAQAAWVLSDSRVLSWAEKSFARVPHLDMLLATDELTEGDSEQWLDPRVDAETLALLQYTSGSTGTPKGVMVTHGNLLHNLSQIHRLDSAGVIGVSWLPPYHDMGLIGGVLLPAYSGRHNVLMSPLSFVQRPFRWLKAISDFRAKTSGGPNFGYELCAQKISAEERRQLDLSSWSVAFSGAEPVRAETLDRFNEAFAPCGFRPETFYPGYGLAEATLKVAGGRKSKPPVIRRFLADQLGQGRGVPTESQSANYRRLVGCGEAIEDQTLRIVDPKTMRECPPGAVGEIWVCGPSIARGYWNRPEDTQETFGAFILETRHHSARHNGNSAQEKPREGPFLRTGDLGFVDDGELFITGRLKDLIIVAGRNHYPQDIERSVQEAHEALRADGGAAFSVEVDAHERLVIVQEVVRPRRFDLTEIITKVRRSVTEQHDLAPAAVVLIKASSLPKTTSGKIQRRDCRERFLEDRLEVLEAWRAEDAIAESATRNGERRLPETRTEQRLAELWQELLGIEKVSSTDDFFAFGGHSLLAMQLLSRITETFAVEFAPEVLFESPVLEQLAARIDECAPGTTPRAAVPICPVARVGALPLSAGQESIWFADQLQRGDSTDGESPGVYHIAFCATLTGSLDLPALERALAELTVRHEALRTTFHLADDGVPRARIEPQMPVQLEREDLRRLHGDDAQRQLEDLSRRAAQSPFDLERGPLFRARLVRLEDERHALIIVLHHLIADGYSLGVLANEWAALYDAFASGGNATLPVQDLDYADFVAWQRNGLNDKSLKRDLDYWTVKLAGAPPLELPAICARSAERPFRGKSKSFDISPELTAQLEQLSRQCGVTLYMTLLAALDVLLWRYSGQTDLVVGSPMAGHRRRELEGVVGHLANTLLLRSDVSDDPTFSELLTQVRKATLDAYAHGSVPAERIIEALRTNQRKNTAPPFNVFFGFEDLPALRRQEKGIQLDALEIDYGQMVPVDWSLFVERSTAGLKTVLAYDAARFDSALIEAVLVSWRAILTDLVHRPDARLGDLEHIGREKRRELLEDRNDTAQPLPDILTHELFEAQAAKTPDRIAAEFGGASLTYAELDRRANRLAKNLNSLGVGEDILVGIYAERSLEMLAALLAVWKSGGAFLPLDPAYPTDRIEWMLRDSETTVLLTQSHLAERLATPPARVVLLDQELPTAARASQSNSDDGPNGNGTIGHSTMRHAQRSGQNGRRTSKNDGQSLQRSNTSTDPICRSRANGRNSSWDVSENGNGASNGNGSDAARAHATPARSRTHAAANAASRGHQLAYVIYTSGSTGRPKGVEVPHRALVNFLLSFAKEPGLEPDDVLLAVTTLSFDIAMLELLLPLAVGAKTVIADRRTAIDPRELERALRASGATVMQATPTTWRMLCDAGWQPADCFRRVFCGGEPLPGELADRLLERDVELWNFYGPTETTIWSTIAEIEPNARWITIGHPIANTEIYILDSKRRPVGDGVIGELYIGGEGLARGYLNRTELSAERFVAHPFREGARLYRTGDLARWRSGALVECLGRTDHQIKLRGFRIEPAEIEGALAAEQEVRAAVVTIWEPRPGDRRLVAYYVADSSDATGPRSLKSRLRGKLPDYMVPSHLIALEELPKLPNGKLDRGALPTPDSLESPLESGGRSTSRAVRRDEDSERRRQIDFASETERRLADIWRGILNVPAIAPDDNFFEAGGHSLLATQMVSRVRSKFGVELPLRAAFESPTLAALASRIDDARSRPQLQPIATVSRDGDVPLSAAQKRLWFIDQLEPQHPFYNLPVAARIRGPLDVAALQRSLLAMVQRHESLRTTFTCRAGEPVARVHSEMRMPLEVIDLCETNAATREDRLQQELGTHARKPFDLEKGPLLRAVLARMGPCDHAVLLSMHHIVSDGWSMGVLLRELTALYESFRNGEDSPLEPLPLGYVDFAAWQAESLNCDTLEGELEYWKGKLRGTAPLEPIPPDTPREPIPSFRGEVEPLEFSVEETAQLNRLAREHGVTPFMVLLSGFKALLTRYSRQEDISVGTPIANRTREELEGLIGFFVNTLVLRTDLSGDPTFQDLLQRVRDVTLEAYAHQDVPYEKVVEALAPERSRSHAPLFQVAFVFQNVPLETRGSTSGSTNGETGDERRSLEPLEVHNGTSKYDLTLFLWQDGPRLRGRLEYNSDIYDRETVARFGCHFRQFLAAATQDPSAPISRVPLLTEDEREIILGSWNSAPREHAVEGCLHEIVEAQASRAPDRVAVEFQGQELRYDELNQRANQLARRLRDLGVGSEVIVGLAVERSMEMLIGLLGIMKSGGAFVPFESDLPERRLESILGETEARLIVTDRTNAEKFAALGAETILVEDIGEIENSDDEAGNVDSGVVPGNLAYVIYTSGSTGAPKGALIEHASLAGRISDFVHIFRVSSESRFLQFASISFDAALAEIFCPLSVGGTVCLASPAVRLPGAPLARFMQEHRVTVATLPPSVVATLSEQDFPSLETLVTTGERCPASLVQRFAPNRLLINGYGPTETTIGATYHVCTDARRDPPIGRPFPGTEIYILDEHAQPVPVGVPGELCIGGGVVGRGYLRRPGLTAERFIDHPLRDEPGARLYRSGDLTRWRPDGNVEFLGRIDDQIKLHGYRVEPGEIAGVLKQQDRVRDAAVLAREDTPGDKRLVAYVVPWFARENDTNGIERKDQFETQQLDQWKTIFDENYRRVIPTEDATFNIAGWNSSYTGRPMPAEEMREWVDRAVERVLAFAPRRVLEIGCGSGLMLFRIAPHCEAYWGTDLSPDALEYVKRTLASTAGVTAETRLLERGADDFGGLEPASFDTIVLNSVVQYFPCAEYLVRVIEGAARLLKPGGRIFLGDVRSLRLLQDFHTSIELFAADDDVDCNELRQRAERRAAAEQELAVDEALFHTIARELPGGGAAETLLKRGRHHNELSRFRYDVVLHMGAGDREAPATHEELSEGRNVEWDSGSSNLDFFEKHLIDERPAAVRFVNLPDARVEESVRAAELLGETESLTTVREIRGKLAEEEGDSVDPEELCCLGERLGYEVKITRNASGPVSRFEAVFRRRDARGRNARPGSNGFSEGGPEHTRQIARPRNWDDFTNHPLQANIARTLVPQWKKQLEERLPSYMVPGAFVVLDRLPLLQNGKLDRQALPVPSQSRPAWSGRYVAPRDELETRVASIWEELLGVCPVGVTDNFFELGGHSMLAVRLASQIEEDCGRKLPLAALFYDPTVAHLAELLRSGADAATTALVPLQPNGDRRPLFLVHPAGGTVFCYLELAQALGPDQPTFGLQAQGLDGLTPPHTSVDEMVAHYIDSIRAAQPEGPYQLGGWSLGGNLAFEIARQLERQGERIALLALFDAGTMPKDRPAQEADFLPVLMDLFPNEELPSLEALRQMSPEEQLNEFLERAQRAQLAEQGFDASQARHLFEVFQANFKAMLDYRPESYGGKVTLFRAARQANPLGDDATQGWGALAKGGVALHEVDCDHVNMVRAPHVIELADSLGVVLDSIEENK